ncbi:MAG: hypothetical protein GX622_05440 [Bacteroidales bacterium]|jgi:hypothetical protein|nr:hypothetical protein [Bacteroidales bacterium]
MRTTFLPGLVLAFLFFSVSLHAQQECRVLLPGISGSYTGECKKGLAEGEGTASGTDTYTGSFRKGLPDGEGTYIWASGAIYKGHWKGGLRDGRGTYKLRFNDRDSVQEGYWKEDIYIGAKRVAPYTVASRIGITRTSFFKQGTSENFVSFKFARTGSTSFNIDGLMLQGSSGSESVTTAFTGFTEPSFPFTGKVQFRAPNLLNTVINNYELRFTINEPGGWIVTIYY